jgi:acetyl coenzyme A synthetase (ADP forming)-like protein
LESHWPATQIESEEQVDKQSSAFKHESDVVLRDGSTVHVRPVRPDDEQGLTELFRSLSQQSRWQRFFTPAKDAFLVSEAQRESSLDGSDGLGLVATTGPHRRIVGDALFVRYPGEDRAEVAFTIADEFQGRGLGTILLGQLAEIAHNSGVQVFEADVMSANHGMIGMFRESGFPIKVSAGAGQLHVSFPTSLTHQAIESFENRERIASINTLNLFFNPRAVAVIGASRQRATIGAEIFRNLLSYEFAGPVYPINRAAPVVQCVPAYASIEEAPGPVDLAVIAVPAAHVITVAEECSRKGVRALVVISAGFGETGEEGRARQEKLLQVCRDTGMRLIGPNCMGILNTDPSVRLNATFAGVVTPAGRIGFSSQSGALGLAIMDYANSRGLGISTFASVGNKADISGNDLLNYWESDPNTDVILLYLESFGNPKKFSRIARRLGRKKPIVVVKSGRSAAGARATSSHTGALMSHSDVTVDALFKQTGVIRTDTLEELFDVASVLVNQPLPSGPRIGIVTNAGGPAILCADACESRGLEVPVLSEESQKRLRQALLPEASVGNPVDMIASATADNYRDAIRIVAGDNNIDALIVMFTPPLVTKAEDVARAIIDNVKTINRSKPVLAVFLSASGEPEEMRQEEVKIPCYAFPEAAAIALSRAWRYSEWRSKPPASPPGVEGVDRVQAAAIIATALKRGEDWLTPEESAALLRCYGLPMIEQRFVTTPDEAGAAAREIGGEVALKGVGPELVHKTEAGAIRLGLTGEAQVRNAANEMLEDLKKRSITPAGFLVQRMASGGVEMIVGIVHDRQFGPVIACGAGGVMVELLRDVAVRLTPLTREDAAEMVRGLRSYPLLTGFRGASPCDVAALEDGLLRISALAEDLPEVAELDCNPFLVQQSGAVILDARVRVAPAEPQPLLGARR